MSFVGSVRDRVRGGIDRHRDNIGSALTGDSMSDFADNLRDETVIGGGGLINQIGIPIGEYAGGPGRSTIDLPENPGMTIPAAPAIGPAPGPPTAEQIGNAPRGRAITAAPIMQKQQQQAISGDTFNRILPAIKQYESTTGRRIGPQALKAFAEQEFETAANRSAQNKALALQEHGLEVQKWAQAANIDLAQQDQDLRRYNMDTENLFRGAALALQQHGMNTQVALQQYTQQLQATGMTADQAYRYADLSLRAQLGQAGIDAQAQAAEAQGLGAIGSLIGAGVGGYFGGPFGAAIGAGVGGTVLPGLGGLF